MKTNEQFIYFIRKRHYDKKVINKHIECDDYFIFLDEYKTHTYVLNSTLVYSLTKKEWMKSRYLVGVNNKPICDECTDFINAVVKGVLDLNIFESMCEVSSKLKARYNCVLNVDDIGYLETNNPEWLI